MRTVKEKETEVEERLKEIMIRCSGLRCDLSRGMEVRALDRLTVLVSDLASQVLKHEERLSNMPKESLV